MIQFENRYQLNMVGKALSIGDRTSDDKGNAILVVGITYVGVNHEGTHIVVRGYGTIEPY